MKLTFVDKIIYEIENSLERYLNINKTKAVQNEMKQLQKNADRQKAAALQHNEMIKRWHSEVNGLVEREKTKCGRSFECQDPDDCTLNFSRIYDRYMTYIHQCYLHYCPGPFHSENCIQYREYNECYSYLRHPQCKRCGGYHSRW